MPTKSVYRSGQLHFYEGASPFETSLPVAPLVYYDDFVGAGSVVIPAAGSAESGVDWTKKIVGAAPPTVAGVANTANGIVACTLTSASEKQDAAIYHGDQLTFSIEQGLMAEFRFRLSVLPTGNGQATVGLMCAWADNPDSMTAGLFFTARASGLIYCDSDDGTTDKDVTSGVTLTTSDWAIGRIDCTDVTSIKYYINGAQVASSTTFPFAATGASAMVQPFASMYKASGTGVGTLQLDYARVWQKRTT